MWTLHTLIWGTANTVANKQKNIFFKLLSNIRNGTKCLILRFYFIGFFIMAKIYDRL